MKEEKRLELIAQKGKEFTIDYDNDEIGLNGKVTLDFYSSGYVIGLESASGINIFIDVDDIVDCKEKGTTTIYKLKKGGVLEIKPFK